MESGVCGKDREQDPENPTFPGPIKDQPAEPSLMVHACKLMEVEQQDQKFKASLSHIGSLENGNRKSEVRKT